MTVYLKHIVTLIIAQDKRYIKIGLNQNTFWVYASLAI